MSDPSDNIEAALAAELRALKPGEILTLSVDSDVPEFVLMHIDDFDHMAELAGCGRAPPDQPT